MKLAYLFIGAFFIMLLWSNCKKENEIHEKNYLASEQPPTNLPPLMGCDDTSTFKNILDLQSLEYLRNCYVCTAVKQVPGLGEIQWKANCMVSIVDTTLRFGFYTYEPWFEELLPREELSFVFVPMSIGVQPIDNWLQNSGHYVRLWDDGDLISAVWGVDTTCTSYIEIIRLDLEDMEVEGKFEVHLKMIAQFPIGGIYHSERINFFNGRFIAEIEK